MPLYFFDRIDGSISRDQRGSDLANIDQARIEAVVYAGQSLKDQPRMVRAGHPLAIEVRDETRKLLFLVRNQRPRSALGRWPTDAGSSPALDCRLSLRFIAKGELRGGLPRASWRHFELVAFVGEPRQHLRKMRLTGNRNCDLKASCRLFGRLKSEDLGKFSRWLFHASSLARHTLMLTKEQSLIAARFDVCLYRSISAGRRVTLG